MKAMILAAGVGSRLDPLTRNVPKPLAPVAGAPVMEHLVHLLVRHGFTDVIANTHYLGDKIEQYFGDGSQFGAKMLFNRESELLGTAGGVKRVAENFDFFDANETFLVIGGDDLTDIDLTAMLQFHKEKNALVTIGLTEVEDPSQFGVVVLENDGRIQRFVEKPAPGTAPSNLVNTGVYLFSPRVLDLIPSGQFYDFGKELFPLLIEQNAEFYGYASQFHWRDVGSLRDYREAQDDFFDGHLPMSHLKSENRDGIWIGTNCEIHPTAILSAPLIIGNSVTIGEDACVEEKSVIGDNCIIGARARVSHSVLWRGANVQDGTAVFRSILGEYASVLSNVGVFDATIVSPDKAA